MRVSTILYVASAVVFAAIALGAISATPLIGVVLFVSGVAVGNEGK